MIDLYPSLYDWAKFRRTKGGVKLYLVLNHDGDMPAFGVIIDGKVQDLAVTDQRVFIPGNRVVDDLGYHDSQLFAEWPSQGVFPHPAESQYAL